MLMAKTFGRRAMTHPDFSNRNTQKSVQESRKEKLQIE